jgi:hypothetical protein
MPDGEMTAVRVPAIIEPPRRRVHLRAGEADGVEIELLPRRNGGSGR